MGNDRLVAALADFRDADTAETQRRVLDELVGSELIFPTADREPGDKSIRLAFTVDRRGRYILPGFTDERCLSVWLPSGGDYATAPGAGAISALLAGPFAGLVLNPGSEASAFVDRRALELLVAGKITDVADGNGETGLVQKWPPTSN